MVVMSTLSKDQSNYSVYCNTKSSNDKFLTFWDLSNYKGSYNQDTQPTPQFLKLRVLSNLGVLQIYANKAALTSTTLRLLASYVLPTMF